MSAPVQSWVLIPSRNVSETRVCLGPHWADKDPEQRCSLKSPLNKPLPPFLLVAGLRTAALFTWKISAITAVHPKSSEMHPNTAAT